MFSNELWRRLHGSDYTTSHRLVCCAEWIVRHVNYISVKLLPISKLSGGGSWETETLEVQACLAMPVQGRGARTEEGCWRKSLR